MTARTEPLEVWVVAFGDTKPITLSCRLDRDSAEEWRKTYATEDARVAHLVEAGSPEDVAHWRAQAQLWREEADDWRELYERAEQRREAAERLCVDLLGHYDGAIASPRDDGKFDYGTENRAAIDVMRARVEARRGRP